MTATPTLQQVINEGINSALLEVNTSLVGQIVKIDVAKAVCDVQPVTKRKYGDGTVVNLPVLTNVPIAFYRANNAFITLPVKIGDYVLVVFSQRSLEIWLSKGGIVDPLDPRKFDLSDAIAYPGVYPFTDLPQGATADDIIIKNAESKISIKPNGEVIIEGSAIKALADLVVLSGDSDAVALASKVLDELNSIKSSFDSHTHLYSPGPGGPTPSATPAIPMVPPQPVASDKVKAE